MNQNVAVNAQTGCALCGSTEREILFSRSDAIYCTRKQVFSVVRCCRCQFLYTWPKPNENAVKDLYPANYHLLHPEIIARRSWLQIAEYLYLRMWDEAKVFRLKSTIEKYLPDNFLALDIGCSKGNFCYLLKKHFPKATVFGQDFIDTSIFSNSIGVTVISTEQAEKTGPFDLVTAFHLLEHVPDPVNFLKTWGLLIKPAGLLAVEVPLANSWGRKIMGKNWFGWDVPRHLNHFTPATLQKAFELSGFKVENVIYPTSAVDGILVLPIFQSKLSSPVWHAVFALTVGLVSCLLLPYNLLTKWLRCSDYALFIARPVKQNE